MSEEKTLFCRNANKAKNAALGMMTEGCVFLLEIGVLNCVLSGKCRKMQNTLQMMLKLDADI